MTDVTAGHIQMMATSLNLAAPMSASGKVRVLAVFSKERSSVLPDVPTLDETVIPGFAMNAWFGVFAPAGTPPSIVHRLAAALRTIMEDPETGKRLKREGLEVFFKGPDEFSNFLAAETSTWSKLVSQAGIEPR
jgi:tripartite-type tricarboxylate transporter receptor subunit TctC